VYVCYHKLRHAVAPLVTAAELLHQGLVAPNLVNFKCLLINLLYITAIGQCIFWLSVVMATSLIKVN